MTVDSQRSQMSLQLTSEVALGLTEGLDMKGAGPLSTEALGVP